MRPCARTATAGLSLNNFSASKMAMIASRARLSARWLDVYLKTTSIHTQFLEFIFNAVGNELLDAAVPRRCCRALRPVEQRRINLDLFHVFFLLGENALAAHRGRRRKPELGQNR